uniref:Uncharacterized protein n=1 Tax=Rhizophagus irregularis (strain DAOM 181602 / DAOM 197198 / MUCL 43194) TaxID=747089 RepID=U9SYR8_RHIID
MYNSCKKYSRVEVYEANQATVACIQKGDITTWVFKSKSTLKPASDASSTDEIKKTCPGDNTSDSVVDEPAKSAVVKSETKAEVEPP